MNEIREEFEKLPEIADSLSEHILFVGDKYTTPNDSFFDLVNWLNGAWYMYREQQKTIDAYKIILKARIGFDIVNSILDQSKASENQSISDDCQNGIISKGEFLVSSKNSDSGQSKEVSINISKDGKITKIGD